MVKQPKLILREACILDVTRYWPPGRFSEMGAGTGGMTRIFLERGFSGVAHDLGEDSRGLIRLSLQAYVDRISVVDDIAAIPDESCDYLFAFEVLEHIQEDREALVGWARQLRCEGKVLVSVPAHMRKFGRSDEMVGHVRRYEKDELRRLLESCGFTDIQIVNYGFPLTELTRRLSNRMVKQDRSVDHLDPIERSIRSAQAKPRIINRALGLVGSRVFVPFRAVQRWFYRRDLGDGYVATAIKPAR